MRAILINPWAQTIDEIELEPGLAARYAALSGPTATLPGEDPAVEPPADQVRLVDRVELGKSPIGGETVDLWIDDEGMLSERQAYFQLVGGDGSGLDHPTFAGRGVILGSTADGITCGTTLTVARVREKVRFMPLGTMMPKDPVIIAADSFESLEFMRKVSGL